MLDIQGLDLDMRPNCKHHLSNKKESSKSIHEIERPEVRLRPPPLLKCVKNTWWLEVRLLRRFGFRFGWKSCFGGIQLILFNFSIFVDKYDQTLFAPPKFCSRKNAVCSSCVCVSCFAVIFHIFKAFDCILGCVGVTVVVLYICEKSQ